MPVRTRWDISKFYEAFHRVFNPQQFPHYDPHLKPETTPRTTTLLINRRMRGGYGGASSTTWVAVGSGERMVDHSVVRIYEMLDRLTDAPI